MKTVDTLICPDAAQTSALRRWVSDDLISAGEAVQEANQLYIDLVLLRERVRRMKARRAARLAESGVLNMPSSFALIGSAEPVRQIRLQERVDSKRTPERGSGGTLSGVVE